MSNTIDALYDLKNNSWNVTFGEIINQVYLCIGFFEEEKSSITFDTLSFGFSIFNENDNLIFEEIYPKSKETYIETDQKYLVECNLDLVPGSKYKLKIWSKNSNIHTENFYDFETLIPTQPYPSWIWKDGSWNSPISYPQDGLIYQWNEEEKKWGINPDVPAAGSHYLNTETNEWILVPQYELS